MNIRCLYLFNFILVFILLLSSIYLQTSYGFEPCPLCMLQRITFALLGGVFFSGFVLFFKAKWWRMILHVAGLTIAGIGMLLAGRQIWLQHYPNPAGLECGANIQYMLQVLPLTEVIAKIFAGGSECASRGWEFLTLNMSEWAFLWFSSFFGIMLYIIFAEWKRIYVRN